MTKKDEIKRTALGIGLSAAAGFVAGVLIAPKSGKQSREDLSNKTKSELSLAEDKLKLLHSQINELISVAKDGGRELDIDSRAAKKYAMILDSAKSAKEKLSLILDAIKQGGSSEDQELNKAIKEAEQAINHAKSFLLKK
jgi:gas vesicle protein